MRPARNRRAASRRSELGVCSMCENAGMWRIAGKFRAELNAPRLRSRGEGTAAGRPPRPQSRGVLHLSSSVSETRRILPQPRPPVAAPRLWRGLWGGLKRRRRWPIVGVSLLAVRRKDCRRRLQCRSQESRTRRLASPPTRHERSKYELRSIVSCRAPRGPLCSRKSSSKPEVSARFTAISGGVKRSGR